MSKKSTQQYFKECCQDERKSVPSSAYTEVCVALADALSRLETSTYELSSIKPKTDRQNVELNSLADRLEAAEKELEDVAFYRSCMDGQEQVPTIRDQFAMAATTGAAVAAGQCYDTALTAYALADEMMARRKI